MMVVQQKDGLWVRELGNYAEWKLRCPLEGTLRGEVIQAYKKRDQLCIELRDTSGETVLVELHCKGRLPPRGQMIAAPGRLVADGDSFRPKLVWTSERWDDLGEAERFQSRREYIESQAKKVGSPTRISHQPGTIWVVTGAASKALDDVRSAARSYRSRIKPVLTNLFEPTQIAQSIRYAAAQAKTDDIILVCRGGGPWSALEVFESPAVVDALAEVARLCPVVLAVGHKTDLLMVNEKIVGHVAATPSEGMQTIRAKLAKNARKAPEEPKVVYRERIVYRDRVVYRDRADPVGAFVKGASGAMLYALWVSIQVLIKLSDVVAKVWAKLIPKRSSK